MAPLRFDPILGRPALMYLRRLGTSTSKPSPVTVTVDAAGAPAGALSIPVTALSEAIPRNTILVFDRAAGNPDQVKVVVTADADVGATALAVEAFEGASGDGISASLAQNDVAVWDGLYTDFASNNLDFSANEQTQELTAVTHGGSSGVKVGVPQVTSVQPTIQRQGFLLNGSQLLTDLLQNVKTPNANWWGKYVLPDADGNDLMVYEGLGRVFGVGHPTPADNYIQLNYSFRFIDDAFTVTRVAAGS